MNEESLSEVRKNIDNIDNRIIELLAERMEAVQKIVKIKQTSNLPVVDTKRELDKDKQWKEKAKELGLDTEHISKIFENILAMSVDFQNKEINANSSQ